VTHHTVRREILFVKVDQELLRLESKLFVHYIKEKKKKKIGSTIDKENNERTREERELTMAGLLALT